MLAVTIVVLCCLGQPMSGGRSALAALVVRALHNPVMGRVAGWQASRQRLASMGIGCGAA